MYEREVDYFMGLQSGEIAKTLAIYCHERKVDAEGAHGKAIAFLRNQLAVADSEDALSFIYQTIANEHLIYGQVSDAKSAWSDVLARFPADPLSWIHASGFYLYEGSDHALPLSLAEKGCQVAEESGRFVIHAHNTKCRVAKAVGDYQSMTDSINSILSYKRPAQSMDSAYECDFLVDLPDGALNSDLVRRILELCKK